MAKRVWEEKVMVRKKQAAKKKKLIYIPAARIRKMGEKRILRAMAKAEYEKVYTNRTWSRLLNRWDDILAMQKMAARKRVRKRRR